MYVNLHLKKSFSENILVSESDIPYRGPDLYEVRRFDTVYRVMGNIIFSFIKSLSTFSDF